MKVFFKYVLRLMNIMTVYVCSFIIANRLYWSDAGMHRIESCTVYGKDRRVIVQSPIGHYFGLALDETHIYFTNWQRR